MPQSPTSLHPYQKVVIDHLLKDSINPWQRYAPHGGSAVGLASVSGEVLLSGPAGTGKSRACLEKINFCALQWPGSSYLLLRKTRASLSTTGLITYERWVLGEGNPICAGARREHRMFYRYPNGSEITLGGMDNITRVMSSEYDMIYVQEAIEISLEAAESLTTRLRNGVLPFQQLLMDTNPAHPRHWLKMRCDAGATEMIRTRHEDNPRYWDGKRWTQEGRNYLERLDKLTGARRARLRDGVWQLTEGAVYDEFDPQYHVMHRDLEEFQRFIVGVDEGYTNPAAALLFGIDGDGRMHLVQEFYKRNVLQADFVEHCAIWQQEYNVGGFFVDPSAAGLIAAMSARGLYVVGAKNDVNDGIQAVKERLVVQGDGRARLTMEPDAKYTISEAESYVWDKDRAGNVRDKPAKENDHAMDATRYAVGGVAMPTTIETAPSLYQ